MYKGLKKTCWGLWAAFSEKVYIIYYKDTDTHKKGVELLHFLHLLIAVLGKP